MSNDLARELMRRTVPGTLYEQTASGALRCTACAHRCVVPDGRAGACGVRSHRDGTLRVPYGYVARRYVRSVETNTIFHVKPGALALTFGMYGCDLRCPYCHNHKVSQALRDGHDVSEGPRDISASDLVDEAIQAGCEVICAAYNEPMISAEWTRAVFEQAKRHDLVTAIISDGNTTPEALKYMRPVTDVYRIDLKAYDERAYHTLGGQIAPVLAAIPLAKELGYWVEVVTLVVPSFNDEVSGLRRLADHIVDVDPLIPWHLNAFVPRYRMADRLRTDGRLLMTAAGSAYARGLKYVYVGNHPEVLELAHTRCAACHTVIIKRHDYVTQSSTLRGGACPECRACIPGVW